MNASYTIEDNAYERIAISLAELMGQVSEDIECDLHHLLTAAYRAAYQKATEEARQD